VSQLTQALVDQLLLEQGEYLPLELLLREGRLQYADYEAWRLGEQALLADALFGDLEHIRQLLFDAEGYLQRRGWQAEAIEYTAWRAMRPDSRAPALRFSAEQTLNECFHRRYRKPQEQPQFDLFTDSPATSLAGGIVQALIDCNPTEARRLVERLADLAPDDSRLGELERLTEASEVLSSPVADIRAELSRLQDTLTPLAGNALGPASRQLLIPLWRRLSQALEGRDFDIDEPELHLSFSAAQAQDWSAAREAVEREVDWRSQPVLLLRHAHACDRQHDYVAAWHSWVTLCWQWPGQAGALDTSSNSELRQLWRAFQDLDTELSATTFPAWVLLARPGLFGILPAPAIGDNNSCPESYRTLCALQQDRSEPAAVSNTDGMALRARLKEQDPELFEHFLAAIAP